MSSSLRHPTALVAPDATLAADVVVGPYALIESGVSIAEGCRIEAHAIIRSGSTLGRQVFVDSHAVVGGLPQDTHFDPATPSGVQVGDHTVLREGVTLHRSTQAGGMTQVGAHCMLMAGAHVAHDCRVEDHAILANHVLLGGYVQVGAWAFLGGGAVFHQFLRIGAHAMVSGNGAFSETIPPYTVAADRNTIYGLNLIGLKRRGFSPEHLADIKRCYRAVYLRAGQPVGLARAALESGVAQTDCGRSFLEFLATTDKRAPSRSRANRRGAEAEGP